jgi:hypothetical protein
VAWLANEKMVHLIRYTADVWKPGRTKNNGRVTGSRSLNPIVNRRLLPDGLLTLPYRANLFEIVSLVKSCGRREGFARKRHDLLQGYVLRIG